jgi:hypothetical protein
MEAAYMVDPIRTVCSAVVLCETREKLQNKARTRNEEVGRTNTWKEEKLSWTSAEDAITKSLKQLLY